LWRNNRLFLRDNSFSANHIIEQLILCICTFPFAVKDFRRFYSGMPKNISFSTISSAANSTIAGMCKFSNEILGNAGRHKHTTSYSAEYTQEAIYNRSEYARVVSLFRFLFLRELAPIFIVTSKTIRSSCNNAEYLIWHIRYDRSSFVTSLQDKSVSKSK